MRILLFSLILVVGLVTPKLVGAVDWPVIGSTFYFWWDEAQNPDPNYFFYKPMEYSYETGKLVNFGPEYETWWKGGMSDLEAAGINVVFPVLWAQYTNKGIMRGERSIYPYIPKMVKVIEENGFDLKVGFFSASEIITFNSETEWYNFYIDNELIPFFRTVPKSMIATHNGESIINGGRPILMFWSWSIPNAVSGDKLIGIYRQKVQELIGLNPFIVIETNSQNLFNSNSYDGMWDWNRTIGPATNYLKNHYRIAATGVGNNEALIRPWRCPGPDRSGPNNFKPRNLKNDGSLDPVGAREAAKIVDDFRMVPDDTNFLFIQDSNEMAEGSGWIRMQNYPKMDHPLIDWCAPNWSMSDKDYKPGDRLGNVHDEYRLLDNQNKDKLLAPDYYISKIRQEIENKWGKKEYDFQVLEQNIPMNITSNGSYNLKIKNKGSKTWKKDVFKLGYRLYEKGSSEVAMDLLKNERLFVLSGDVVTGDKIDINFTFDVSKLNGLSGEYVLKIDMIEEGVTWFEWKRNGALRRTISLPLTDKPECIPVGEGTGIVDLIRWYGAYKNGTENGDLNCDGSTNISDLVFWYGKYKN